MKPKENPTGLVDEELADLKQKVVATFKLSYSLLGLEADVTDVIYDHIALYPEDRKKEMAKLLCFFLDRLDCGEDASDISDLANVLVHKSYGVEQLDQDEVEYGKRFSTPERACLLECLELFRERLPLWASEIQEAIEFWT